MDIRELMGNTSGLRQDDADMTDPRQHFAWALAFFPSPNTQMGDVPIQPAVRPGLSQLLWDLGFRHDPAAQTKWFVPGDHPEAAWMNVPQLVTAEEYQQWAAVNDNPAAANEKWRQTAETLMDAIDPKLVPRINNMTEEQRAAALELQRSRIPEEFREQMPAAFERLAELKKQMDGEA